MTSTNKWTNVKLLAVVIFCSAFISAGVFAGQMPYEKGVRILPGQWRPHCPYEHIAWIRQFWTRLEPFTQGFYSNDGAPEAYTPDSIATNYRENYARLVEAKNRYDPTNLFRLNANVQPTV